MSAAIDDMVSPVEKLWARILSSASVGGIDNWIATTPDAW